MIYFTSDQHLSHKKVIEYCNRPFQTVEEMNECIIDNFNSIVSPIDTTYFLGDFCFSNGNFEKYMKMLNGQKHFVIGNHDPKNIKKFTHLFNSISQIKQIEVNGKTIVLCHFPMYIWNKKQYGAIHFHGHCHGALKQYTNTNNLTIDVGVDCWNFKPVSFDQVKYKMYKMRGF